MAYILNLKTYKDERGRLTPVDGVLPFEMVRLYYIDEISDNAERGGHMHFVTVEAIFCVFGSFAVVINDGKTKREYVLTDRSQCLIVEPGDWHMIHSFSPGAILMGVSSTHYDHTDYQLEEPALQHDSL